MFSEIILSKHLEGEWNEKRLERPSMLKAPVMKVQVDNNLSGFYIQIWLSKASGLVGKAWLNKGWLA